MFLLMASRCVHEDNSNWAFVGGHFIVRCFDTQNRLDTEDGCAKFVSSPGAAASVANEAALAQWWAALDDPTLTSLIKRAAESNFDLKLAAERLLEARAARQLSRSDLLPTLEGSTSSSTDSRWLQPGHYSRWRKRVARTDFGV